MALLYLLVTSGLVTFASFMRRSIEYRFSGLPLPNITWFVVMDLKFLILQPVVAFSTASVVWWMARKRNDAAALVGLTLVFWAFVVLFLVVMGSLSPWLPFPQGIHQNIQK